MAVRQLTNAADPLHRALVFNFAAQRVAGVGRINDYPALTHNLHRTVNQPCLRVIRMDIKTGSYFPLNFIRRPLPNCARRLPRRQEARAYGQVRSTRRADENRIPATPEDQTARRGGQLGAFMGRLLTLGHFHGITALLAKVGQQPLQPLGGEIVAPGMGNHRLAARMMNHINRLFYCTPLRRHVTGFPAGKVFLKTSAMFSHGRSQPENGQNGRG